MPSLAARSFNTAIERGQVLRSLATSHRLQPISTRDAQACLHAALASHVAAWEGYCEAVVREFFGAVSDPSRADFAGLHQIAEGFSSGQTDRFNTPTFENSRNLILSCTGYDPISAWTWQARGRPVTWVQERLNQVLKARHSFAHGAPVPSYLWTQGPAGRVRLTTAAIDDIAALLRNLVRQTDRGLSHHINLVYAQKVRW